jgi:hypothetical protein
MTQVEVHFHGIEKSEAIEQRVRDKVAKLQKHFERMTSCRVAIEAPQRSTPQKPKVYQIKIEIGMGSPFATPSRLPGARWTPWPPRSASAASSTAAVASRGRRRSRRRELSFRRFARALLRRRHLRSVEVARIDDRVSGVADP